MKNLIKEKARERATDLASARLGGAQVSELEWEYERGFHAGMMFLQRMISGETRKLQEELDEYRKDEA